MIRKKDLSENFSNEALEYAIKNVVSENSQDNQNTLISELLNTYLYTRFHTFTKNRKQRNISTRFYKYAGDEIRKGKI